MFDHPLSGLEMHPLNESACQSPFREDSNFHFGWWQGLSPGLLSGLVSLTFTSGRAELVRARVRVPASVAADHRGLDRSADSIEIDKFETNVRARGQGWGKTAIEFLKRERPDAVILVRPVDDDSLEFWRHIGFRQLGRRDGDPGFGPLLALRPQY